MIIGSKMQETFSVFDLASVVIELILGTKIKAFTFARGRVRTVNNI